MPEELKEEMMDKLLEAIKSGKVKAVSIAFEGDDKDFKPHKMYDKEGKEYDADTEEAHKEMKSKGYSHKEDCDCGDKDCDNCDETESDDEENTMMEIKEALKNVKNLKKYSKIMK